MSPDPSPFANLREAATAESRRCLPLGDTGLGLAEDGGDVRERGPDDRDLVLLALAEPTAATAMGRDFVLLAALVFADV